MKKLSLCIWLLTQGLVMAQITGRVLDQDTLAPIEGATVKIQTSAVSTTTDAAGNFTLNDTDIFPYTLTASKWHYFNVGATLTTEKDTTGVELLLESFPEPTRGIEDPYIPTAPANNCGGCHFTQWTEFIDSPMKETGLNKWVFDFYSGTGTAGGMNGFVYQRDSVHREHAPNSDCSACHTPVHWLSDIETAGMGDINNPTEDMELGVQCEVCHRAYEVPDDKLNFPGVHPEGFTFVRDTSPLLFGLNRDVDFNAGPMRAAYNPILASRVCASCHEDNVDTNANGDFEDEVTFHETTYSSWKEYVKLHGDNAQSCMDCHMPVTDSVFFCGASSINREGTIRSHDIRGTTPEYLENAVTVSLENSIGFDNASVRVTITNDGAGHSVPTGIMIRNMILLVSISDAKTTPLNFVGGDTVDDIGGIGDPSEGYYAGLPGKAFYLNMQDADGNRVFYTEAVGVPVDNRIRPGQSYVGDFTFDLNGAVPDGLAVDARLIYRRADRAFIDLKGWTQTGHDEPLADLEAPHFGHLMEHETATVTPCNAANTDEFIIEFSPFWQQDTPILTEVGPQANILHFVTLANCQ